MTNLRSKLTSSLGIRNVMVIAVAAAVLLVAILLATIGVVNRDQAVSDDSDTATCNNHLDQSADRRPVSVDDFVTTNGVKDVQFSPDDSQVAMLTTSGDIERNEICSTIWVGDADDPDTILPVYRHPGLESNLRWHPDAQALTFLSYRDGVQRPWRLDLDSKETDVLFDIPGPAEKIGGASYHFEDQDTPLRRAVVMRFEWSPDGRHVAYLQPRGTAQDKQRDREASGVVYDDERFLTGPFNLGDYDGTVSDLWVLDTETGERRRARTFPSSELFDLAWSPDGSRFAVSFESFDPTAESGTPFFASIAVDDLAVTNLSKDFAPSALAWRADSSAVTAVFEKGATDYPVDGSEARPLSDQVTGLDGLWWTGEDDDQRLIAVESANVDTADGDPRSRLQVFDPSTDKMKTVDAGSDSLGELGACGFTVTTGRGLCERQGLRTPPTVAAVGGIDGQVEPAVDINPHLSELRYGKVESLTWTNKYGSKSAGYLIYPLGYQEGARYPTVVINHAYDAQRNVFANLSLTGGRYNYDAFAAEGYAVLLVNEAVPAPPQGEEIASQWQAFMGEAVATMETAARDAVERGVADPDRIGIAGYSRGAQVTYAAMRHSDVFDAASASEGDVLDNSYWLAGNLSATVQWDQIFGGPPIGPNRDAWEKYSPALGADRICTPLLQEYGKDVYHTALQMQIYLRKFDTPAELVVYPNDSHIFSQPAHQQASMNRNIAWFDFWLRGRADRSRDLNKDYTRWDEMRQQQTARGEC